MGKKNEATTKQKPKKVGRKTRKVEKTKNRKIKRVAIKNWSLTEKIEHLWSNLKYATTFSEEIISWGSHKPKMFFLKIKQYMQGIIFPKKKAREYNLRKKLYLKEKQKKKKVNLLDHSYIMVKEYFENAKRNQIKGRDMDRRLKRFESVLNSYQDLLEIQSKPNPQKVHQHNHLMSKQVKDMIKEVEKQHSQPSIPFQTTNQVRTTRRTTRIKQMGELQEARPEARENKEPEKKLKSSKKQPIPPAPPRFRYSEREYKNDDNGDQEQQEREEEEVKSQNQREEEIIREEVQDEVRELGQSSNKVEDSKNLSQRKVELKDDEEKKNANKEIGQLVKRLLRNVQKKRDELREKKRDE